MRESCLVYCYSGIQSLFEVVLLYTFYTRTLHCQCGVKGDLVTSQLHCKGVRLVDEFLYALQFHLQVFIR